MRLSIIVIAAVSSVWAFIATSDLRTAVVGAETIEGTIAAIEGRRLRDRTSSRRRLKNRAPRPDYFEVHVTFTTADGQEVTRTAQADGPEPDDVEFDPDTLEDTGLAVGDTVTLLYHPELGDLVWIDDFWLLWIFPLFLCLVALVGTAVVVVLGFVAFASKPEASS